MARKRKGRRLKAAPVLWLLLIVNVTVALMMSSATAATHIRVKGADVADRARITKELQWLKGRPYLSVNAASVEETILQRPDLKTADLSRNPFGGGELALVYYQPVALLENTKNVVLTDGGTLCAIPNADPQLPVLHLFPEAFSPSMGISTMWEPNLVAQIVRRASSEGMLKNLSITVTVGGSVCLNSGVTGRVNFGAPDALDDKFSEMKKILAAQPNLMDEGKELVLIAPTKPVTRPLQGTP